jgi:2-octaprenyl-6-methoxyphenol hydroxylase
MKRFDVIVLGGGPNGLAAALALGGYTLPRPLNVLVLDIRDPRHLTDDTRGTALTRATQAMFKTLGLWDELQPNATEMRDIIVTDAAGSHLDRPVLLAFDTAGSAQAAASIVENRHLNAALVAAVDRSPHITMQGGFSFEKLIHTSGSIAVHSISDDSYQASLLVAADGRQSKIRDALAIKLSTHDYHQTALSFTIHHELPHNQTAEEHFSPDGVFAVLPLTGHRSSIVWGTTPDNARQLLALSDDAFNAALQAQMADRLGPIGVEGRRVAYPIIMQIAEEFIGPRVALMGDAAHAIHPLAGLGLNLGFKDAAALADTVAQTFALGGDIGGPTVLEHYQTARRFDTVLTSLSMDAMNSLFVNDNPILQTLRRLGLKGVNQVPQAKSFFMSQASGISNQNPLLMQGRLPG